MRIVAFILSCVLALIGAIARFDVVIDILEDVRHDGLLTKIAILFFALPAGFIAAAWHNYELIYDNVHNKAGMP